MLKCGHEHYAFAVRTCLSLIADWRRESTITLPMEYIFDWEMKGTDKHRDVSAIWDNMHELLAKELGYERDAYGFRHKADFKPLQASDILAWQMNSHMVKMLRDGEEEDLPELAHPGFRLLREDQEMPLAFFTESQLEKFVRKYEALEQAGLTVAF